MVPRIGLHWAPTAPPYWVSTSVPTDWLPTTFHVPVPDAGHPSANAEIAERSATTPTANFNFIRSAFPKPSFRLPARPLGEGEDKVVRYWRRVLRKRQEQSQKIHGSCRENAGVIVARGPYNADHGAARHGRRRDHRHRAR